MASPLNPTDMQTEYSISRETTDKNILFCLEQYESFTRGSIYTIGDITTVKLCDRLFNAIRTKQTPMQVYLLALEVRDYIWEALHSKGWNRVDLCCRDAFGLISLVAAVTYQVQDETGDTSTHEESQIALADYGILLGSQLYHNDLQQLIIAISEKNKVNLAIDRAGNFDDSWPNHSLDVTDHPKFPSTLNCESKEDVDESEGSRENLRFRNQRHYQQQPVFLFTETDKPCRAKPIARKNAPNILCFYENCLLTSNPTVLTGCMENWSALEKWKDLGYLIEVAGNRSVPIEIGSSYLSDNYNQKLILVKDFIQHYISKSTEDDNIKNNLNNPNDKSCTVIEEGRTNDIGYLAQHRLFDQIPMLLKDILTPDYCALLTPDDEDENDDENQIENNNDNGNEQENDSDVRVLKQRSEIDGDKDIDKDLNKDINKDNANSSSSPYIPSLTSSPFLQSSSSSTISHLPIRIHTTRDLSESTETVSNTSLKDIALTKETSPPSPRAVCDEIILNMWMGPSRTTSPLHHDPYHNILSQVVGCKYVRLYHPNMSEYLYPRKGRMSNNSEVDLTLLGEDRDRFPLSASASCTYSETVLRAGEMLFIPRWHWHFVAAITEAQADYWTATQHAKELERQKKNSVIEKEEKKTRGRECEHHDIHFHENVDFGKKRKRISSLETLSKVDLDEDLSQKDSEDSTGEKKEKIADSMKLNEKKVIGLEFVDPEFSISVSFWWGKRILKPT